MILCPSGSLHGALKDNTKLAMTREYAVRHAHLKEDIERMLDSRSYDHEADVFIVMCSIECMTELLKQVKLIVMCSIECMTELLKQVL